MSCYVIWPEREEIRAQMHTIQGGVVVFAAGWGAGTGHLIGENAI